MEVSWDADNFEPKLPTTLTSSNKWEGEDEEELVKESWEDEEEEKKDEEKKEQVVAAPPPAKPKKKILDKIVEKERLEREKAERLTTEKPEELTPEQKIAEKLRRQKLQEEDDLRLAMETFGVTEGGGKLDSFHPTNKEEFTEFAELLCKKITIYKTKEEFPVFADELIRSIIVQMSSGDIKRIKMSVDNIYIEKQKAEKNDKAKKPTKGKGKAKLKVEGDNAHLNQYDAYGNFDDADFDDFM